MLHTVVSTAEHFHVKVSPVPGREVEQDDDEEGHQVEIIIPNDNRQKDDEGDRVVTQPVHGNAPFGAGAVDDLVRQRAPLASEVPIGGHVVLVLSNMLCARAELEDNVVEGGVQHEIAPRHEARIHHRPKAPLHIAHARCVLPMKTGIELRVPVARCVFWEESNHVDDQERACVDEQRSGLVEVVKH